MIILIADDDRLARFNIKSMLGELLGDTGDIFLEARDGEEMVRICGQNDPDIAFVDISMPGMNGLDAIARCRECSSDTEFVLVSGYSDFQYAQKAIRLGVNEYLLKPVDAEQIGVVLDKLQVKVKKKKENSNSRFQLRVMDAFNYYSTLGTIEEEGGDGQQDYAFLTFMLHTAVDSRGSETTAELQKTLMKEVTRLGRTVVSRKGYYAIASNGNGTPCIVFGTAEGQKEYILSHMRKISTSVSGMKEIHYFLWFESKTLLHVCSNCEKLETDMCLLMQEPPGSVCRAEELNRGGKEADFLHLVEQLTEAWQRADGVACRENMNTMWRSFGMENLNLNLENMSNYCSFVTGCDIKKNSLKEFCRSFVECSEQMYSGLHRADGDVIDQVKEYIQKYYMNDIGIGQIAEHFHLTANYLSTIFHQRTGRRFIDFLTEVRIEAAKKLLLQNSSASVRDIALMVGYNSARHFSSLFQKKTGMTPSAFRKERV